MLYCFKKAFIEHLLHTEQRVDWEERATEIKRRWIPIHEGFTWEMKAPLDLRVTHIVTTWEQLDPTNIY